MSGTEGPDRPETGLPGGPPIPPGYPQPPAPSSGYPAPPGYPPPGFAPPGYPQPPDLAGGRQNGDRARTAIWVGLVAFVLQATCSVVVLVTMRDFYVDLFDAMSSGRRLTAADTTPPTDAASTVASAVSQLSSFVLIGVGIIFLIWVHKALTNARALGLPLRHTPGWGVAGFIVPIINLWFPYQSMRDLFPADHPARARVGRWFACYLGASFASTFAGFAALVSPAAGGALLILVAGLYAVAAVTIRELITASSEAHAELAAASGAPTAGWTGAPGWPPPGPVAPGPAPVAGQAAGWPMPPPAPPKDPWNRT